MLTRRNLLSAWTATLVGLSLETTSRLASAGGTRLVVIVAKSSPVNELSLAQLRRMYMGEPTDAGGQRMVPINQGPSVNERVAFDRLVLGMTKEEVARYWVDRRIRGQSGAPKAIDPVDVHQRVVAKLPGAVGYVRSTEVRGEVKVVRIDGKAPTEGGYPLEF